jgi:hypothetical protein
MVRSENSVTSPMPATPAMATAPMPATWSASQPVAPGTGAAGAGSVAMGRAAQAVGKT